MNEEQKKELMKNSGFKCKKCGYYSPVESELELNKNFNVVLCLVCNTFAPADKETFDKYIQEQIDWQSLESFRNSGMNRASHSPHKRGMMEKSREGKLVTRPPFGYSVKKGELIEDMENSENVRLIFKEFADGKSLNQISKTYGLSVNGVKKILKNFTYLGKVKFDNQISQGSHKPLISAELFNRVQQMFEKKEA
jgi:transcription elongation factor Elf1